jgi:hypothetical protein
MNRAGLVDDQIRHPSRLSMPRFPGSKFFLARSFNAFLTISNGGFTNADRKAPSSLVSL